MQHHEHRMSVFFFFEFFILSDILKKEQLGFGQIVYYLKLDSGTGYIFHKSPHFLGEWEIICLCERE